MSKQRELRPEEASSAPWLIAIDLDGTTINDRGQASTAVQREIKKVEHEGHHLLVATGRSPATTIPVIQHLGTFPEYVVCSNGAVILQRDVAADHGYRRMRATGFEATAALEAIRAHFPDARFAVEDANGQYRFTHPFPAATTVPEEDQTIVPVTADCHRRRLQRHRTARMGRSRRPWGRDGARPRCVAGGCDRDHGDIGRRRPRASPINAIGLVRWIFSASAR